MNIFHKANYQYFRRYDLRNGMLIEAHRFPRRAAAVVGVMGAMRATRSVHRAHAADLLRRARRSGRFVTA